MAVKRVRGYKLKDFCKVCGKSFSEVKRHTYKDKTRGERRFNECVECAKRRYRTYNIKRVLKWDSLKHNIILQRGGCCEICGYNDLSCVACFDFHHLDSYKKEFSLSRYIDGKPFKSEYVNAYKRESDKCLIVCSNCHRKIHSFVINFHKKKDIIL